jgi:hypothetical protein
MASLQTEAGARWGFSYFTVRDAEGFAPVITLLRAEDRNL